MTEVIELDVNPADLLYTEFGCLSSLVTQISYKWYPSLDRKLLPRCGTAYISNAADGNGEIRIVLRFPLDLGEVVSKKPGLIEPEAKHRHLRCVEDSND